MQIREVRAEEHERVGALTYEAFAALRQGDSLGEYGTQLRDVTARAADAVVLVAEVLARARAAGKQRVRDETLDFEPEPGTVILGFRYEFGGQ